MRTTVTLLIVAALLALVCSCFFIVDETEFVIQLRFGDPVNTRTEPGLYVKWPWPIDLLARFDNRLMVLENPAPGEADKEYLTQDEESGIGKNVVVTTYTCWRIKPDPNAALLFLKTMRDIPSAEARLGDIVVAELGVALGEHDFSVLVTTDESQHRWAQFLEDVRAKCAARVKDAYGIEVLDIKIQRLNFPDQNRRNVFDRMRAERETIATRYRSEGMEQATRVRAQANRQREELLAQAIEERERIRGDADAEAARTYAEAYGQDPDFYDFMRTLEAYETTLKENTVAVLSGSSDFLRLLNRPPRSLSPTTQPSTEE